MIDFVTSLNKGFELAQQADENNKEIDAVFAELNRQLNEVYGGKVIIERYDSIDMAKKLFNILKAETYPDHSVNNRKVIVALNPQSRIDTKKSIANWEQSSTGYLCSIAYAGQKHICADKESLELAIADLLADPFVAKTLLKVINAESTESAE